MLRHFFIMGALWAATQAHATPVPVAFTTEGGMTRGGKPYFIKGAGGETNLAELAKRGGNSIRTWSTDDLPTTLPEAEKLGLTVSAGIWLEPECNWFSYTNPEHCAKQVKRVTDAVKAHADHPAMLAWGLGNEAEGDGENAAYWKQLEVLAKLVRSLDPHHPTFTAVAGLSPKKTQGLNQHTPSLHFLGINTYGALPRIREKTKADGWKRPYAVTEYGTRGFWEIAKNSFGAPLEPLPQAKADFIEKAYNAAILPGSPCIGGYAFLWGQKNEATATWFGMLTPENHTTPMVDALERVWTGKAPKNHAPVITELESATANQTIAAGTSFEAKATAKDAENDAMTWKWTVLTECSGHHDAKGRPFPPKPHPEAILSAKESAASFKAPKKPGIYRVYAEVSDGKGHVSTANFAFRVP